jgi:hypothetical protein
MSGISRRKLLRTGRQAIIAGGVAVCGPSLQARPSSKSKSATGVFRSRLAKSAAVLSTD